MPATCILSPPKDFLLTVTTVNMPPTDRKPAAAEPAVPTAAPETGENASHAHAMEPDEAHGGDGEEDIDDGLYSSDGASSTTSLSSSIFAYRTLQGRTYHSNLGNAEYWYVRHGTFALVISRRKLNALTPPSQGSQRRTPKRSARHHVSSIHTPPTPTLSLQVPTTQRNADWPGFCSHHVLTLLLDGELHRAPISSDASLNVLDVGTGTGLWAIDFGDKYPSATVLGTDISPIQPNWVPPNVSLYDPHPTPLFPVFPFFSLFFQHVHFSYADLSRD